MKKYYSLSLVLLCLISIGQVKKDAKEQAMPALSQSSLKLHIEVDRNTDDCSAVRLCFENTSKKKITLLRHFSSLDVFFSFNLTKLDGTPISGGPRGGKISLGPDVEYITLKPGEFFGFKIQISDFYNKLEPGKYRLSVMYHNQYGNECYKGRLKSNSIELDYQQKGGKKNLDEKRSPQ